MVIKYNYITIIISVEVLQLLQSSWVKIDQGCWATGLSLRGLASKLRQIQKTWLASTAVRLLR